MKVEPLRLPAGRVERLCQRASEAAILAMLGLIALDIVTRWLFNFSFEIADELGGYLLVAITFLSLAVCQTSGSFHEVEFVQARLSPAAQALSHALFDLFALAFSLLVLWQYGRMVLATWRFDERAPTYLETALWIPRMVMVIGMAALCLALVRTLLAHLARWRAAR